MDFTKVVNDIESNPTRAEFNKLKRPLLNELCLHYQIELQTDHYISKKEYVDILLCYFADNDMLTESQLSEFEAGMQASGQRSVDVTPQYIQLRQLEMQHEREQENARHRHELAMKRLELNITNSDNNDEFNVSRNIRLVPKFCEENVDEFFNQFERVATQMNWPKDKYNILLQTSLMGKAQECYNSLALDKISNYDELKTQILRSYELIPEAYRLKKFDIDTNVSYLEFLRKKKVLFDRWLNSVQVKNDYNKLYNLMLIEEFKRQLPQEIKTFIEEKECQDPYDAAKKADEYYLTHKIVKNNKTTFKFNFNKENLTGSNYENNENKTNTCWKCGKSGHFKKECTFQVKSTAFIKTLSKELENTKTKNIDPSFLPYVFDGTITIDKKMFDVKILRDTGSNKTLVLSNVCNLTDQTHSEFVLLSGLGGVVTVPLQHVYINCELFTGTAQVGVVNQLPVEGIQIILGNDLSDDNINYYNVPHMIQNPKLDVSDDNSENDFPNLFPSCVVTRSKKAMNDCTAKQLNLSRELEDLHVLPSDNKFNPNSLISAQISDPKINKLRKKAPEESCVSKLPTAYYLQNGVLMRKYHPKDEPIDNVWLTKHQIVIPQNYRIKLISVAHDVTMSGHRGIEKTLSKLQQHFFWPKQKTDVKKFVKSCHECQIAGKAGHHPKKAPLIPVPVLGEPFQKIQIDCVGPLPVTKARNVYILTVLCTATRYPEAFALRNIKATTICETLKDFFSHYGFPIIIQTDQGSNFMSNQFEQLLKELGVKHVTSTPYHPMSQGAIEKFHCSLKTMLRTFCQNNEKDWDKILPMLLFAVRDCVNESLGFTPFELVFGHEIRNPLKIFKENWLDNEVTQTNLLCYVQDFKDKLLNAWDSAQKHLDESQTDMKEWYDRNSRERSFSIGDKVLALLPVRNSPFTAKYGGPYKVLKCLNSVNYVIETPDRRKSKQLCHINMLKPYIERDNVFTDEGVSATVCIGAATPADTEDVLNDDLNEVFVKPKLTNSVILENLDDKLVHLTLSQQEELKTIILDFKDIFKDVPSRTNLIEHDVNVGNNSPIKQHPYRVNPNKLAAFDTEIEYMLSNDIIEPSKSAWSSPCILIPKPDGTQRFVTDFRKVNSITVPDSYPLPRILDCIDCIGNAMYVTTCDLLKGYWAVPLTQRAKEISAFVTPKGLWQYKVAPYGMRNSGATFQRLMNQVTHGLSNTAVYVDDVAIWSNDWTSHLLYIKEFFCG